MCELLLKNAYRYWTAGNAMAAKPAATASQSTNSINVNPDLLSFICLLSKDSFK